MATIAPYAVVSSTTVPMAGIKRAKITHNAAPPSNLVVASAQPILTVSQSEGAKRPQMKYDPDVPMTKEQTSAWRREQRRKRNRESAAACRKRQRDRISELEVEVSDWKAKFDDALAKLKAIDGTQGAELEAQLEVLLPIKKRIERCTTPPAVPEGVTSITIPVSKQQMQRGNNTSHVISPYDRPKFVPPIVPSSSSATVSFPVLQAPTSNKQSKVSTKKFHPSDSILPRVEKSTTVTTTTAFTTDDKHLNEIITRPAVKITGAIKNTVSSNDNSTSTPLTSIESVCDDLLQVVPDSCLSLTERKTMPFPEACPSLVVPQAGGSSSLPLGSDVASADDIMAAAASDVLMTAATTTDESVPGVTTDESDEDSDLGEFLLDAVQWL